MSDRIVYQPSSKYIKDLITLEIQCFPDEPLDEEAFSSMITNEFWIALNEDNLIGYGYLKVKPELAWIARIGVAPRERSRGIGARLMDMMLRRCEEIPRETIILYVQQDNPAAIHLYRKFNFDITEESFQYIVESAWIHVQRDSGMEQQLKVSPITEVPLRIRPVFSGQWSNLAELHDPPKTYVFVFIHETIGTIGYCRLSPEFPGCFPFELQSPSTMLASVLGALEPYLSRNYPILKLTFADPGIAHACDTLDFRLNYRLYMMTRKLQNSPVD